ncbi:hypothetical protein HAX54_042748 [Datura stramonium]|uniref:Uncharacterized protein n=1 Tax=Datura stramonium TaxID=4076 RepID=A0ABS8SMJ9_DATST|nr:hypothetical protein [Datura stramonium]
MDRGPPSVTSVEDSMLHENSILYSSTKSHGTGEACHPRTKPANSTSKASPTARNGMDVEGGDLLYLYNDDSFSSTTFLMLMKASCMWNIIFPEIPSILTSATERW